MLVLSLAVVCPSAAGQLQPFDQSQRDRQFEQLSNDVASLDRQLSIYKRVANLVRPSVVHIEATPLETFPSRRELEEAGTGIVVQWRDRKYILTNRHVIKHSDPSRIRIELADGRRLSPRRILSDRDTDVAVMDLEEQSLVPARIGDSDAAEIGDLVMAFGSPFNLQQSVTLGIISARGRTNLDLGDGDVRYQNFLQTDAAINPGNSGGPLVNLRGEVIGLNTAIASNSGGNEGIGFSIPANVAFEVLRQLVDNGRVERGFLGVKLDANFDTRTARLVNLPRLMGTRVTGVTPNGPAAKAGIQVDDVIVRFDGVAVESMDHLINLVNRTAIDRTARLILYRDSQVVQTEVVVGRRTEFAEPEENPR